MRKSLLFVLAMFAALVVWFALFEVTLQQGHYQNAFFETVVLFVIEVLLVSFHRSHVLRAARRR